jgi:hypothetical protein
MNGDDGDNACINFLMRAIYRNLRHALSPLSPPPP